MPVNEDRKLAAIMFTDIVGYSSMMSVDESEAVKSLKEKESVLTPLITNHNGNLVKNIGDGTLSYYNSAIDAVRCGIELQKSFQKNKGLRIRVGIHLGDIILENNDIYGDGVNIASRLESMALEGSILISKDVYDQLTNHAEFDAVSLGLQSLKGVGRLIEIYGVKNEHIVTPDPAEYKNNLVQHHQEDAGVPSVAIIPFENKGSKEDAFYSFGISSGLIKTCSQAGMIRVESLNDIEKIENYSSLSLKELGQKLSVKYIVKGTLWKIDNIFQLSIEVYNNQESKVVWNDHFEEDWENLSLIKSKLADGVLKTLDKKTNSSSTNNTIDSIAYEYHLKANFQYQIRQNSEDTEIIRSLYKKAIKLAPNLIDARMGLGLTYLETGDYDRAKDIYKEAIQIAESINDLRGKASSFDGLGNIHWHKGNYDKSLENLYISLDIMKNLNNQSGIVKSLHQIGHNYYYKGNHDKAHQYYNRSIDIIKEIDDKHNMGKVLLSLGNIYEAKKDIDRSLKCYKDAYLIFKEFKNKYAAGYAQMGIGNMYKKLKEYDKAIEFYESSLTTRIEIEDKSGIALLNHNIAVIYKETYNYRLALELFNKALAITDELGDRYSSSASLKNMGEIYRIKGEYSESLEIHKKSLKIREDLELSDFVGESLNQLALTCFLNNDLDKASKYIKKTKEVKFQDDDQLALRDLYDILISGKVTDRDILKKVIENVEENQNITYETYYFLYKVSNEPKYLKLAKQYFKEIQENHIKSLALSDYPIPTLLLNLKE